MLWPCILPVISFQILMQIKTQTVIGDIDLLILCAKTPNAFCKSKKVAFQITAS